MVPARNPPGSRTRRDSSGTDLLPETWPSPEGEGCFPEKLSSLAKKMICRTGDGLSRPEGPPSDLTGMPASVVGCGGMYRRMYISLLITMSATALGASIVVPLLPVYASEMGARGGELGLIFSAFALARSILLPVVGNLADKHGRRVFLLSGLLIYSMTAVAFAFAHSVRHLIFTRFVQGGGAAMVIPIVRAYAGDLSPPGGEGRTMGHFNMAFFAGLACGPWIGGYIKDLLGIQAAFYSMGALALLGFGLSAATLPSSNSATTAKPAAKAASYVSMLRASSVGAMFLFRFGSIIGLGMNWAFLPLYGHQVVGLSSGRIGILVSLTVLMTTLLQPLFGRMADRSSRAWMTFHGGLWASLFLLAVPLCTSFWHLFAINMLIGSAIGLYMPPLMAMAVDFGRRQDIMGRIMTLLEMAFSFGMVLGPVMAGFLMDSFGLKTIFWAGGGVGILVSAGCLPSFLHYERAAWAKQ